MNIGLSSRPRQRFSRLSILSYIENYTHTQHIQRIEIANTKNIYIYIGNWWAFIIRRRWELVMGIKSQHCREERYIYVYQDQLLSIGAERYEAL